MGWEGEWRGKGGGDEEGKEGMGTVGGKGKVGREGR